MNKIKSISLMFPVYKDRNTVRLMIKKSLNVLKKLKIKYEIVIVDDGCPQNSGKLAKEIAKKVNAYFLDDALYISNNQDDEEDLIDDIIHEIGHAVEKRHDDFIYGDGKIEDEFLLKRSRLKRTLENQGYNVEKYNFLDVEYNEDLDLFLLEEVGYDALSMLSVALFLNPYSATSLSEYFSDGFLDFYLENGVSLKQLCPYIYKKLVVLHEEVEDW